jgi:hypothetical protein
LAERVALQGSPDWESLYDSTPDDTEVDEDASDLEEPIFNRAGMEAIERARSLDMEPVVREIEKILAAPEGERIGLLGELSAKLPEFLESPEFEEWLGLELAKALEVEPLETQDDES